MSTKYVTPVMRELRAAIAEAEMLSAKEELSKRESVRVSVLLAKIATLRANEVAPDDSTNRWVRSLLTGRMSEQRAAMQEGTQAITYTQGAEGGFLVPTEFHDEVIQGMAQFDPLLNRNIVTLIESGDFSLRPYNVPGWDLSTYAAVKVAETSQQNGQTPPTAAGVMFGGGWKYKASLPISTELEDDMFEPTRTLMQSAFGIGMARGVGADLIVGDGTTGPQGLNAGAANSGITPSGGVLINDDIDGIYFSVDAFYRQSSKCGWVMNDATYQVVRKAKDTAGRPLLSVAKDKLLLLDKPVYISPSVGTTTKSIFFGDLSYMLVRVSRMVVTRAAQLPGYVEKGQALYTAILRADAKVFDPTGGSKPPITYTTRS